jgi:hypothetical protein
MARSRKRILPASDELKISGATVQNILKLSTARQQDHLVSQFEIIVRDKDGVEVGRAKSPVTDMLMNNFGQFLSGLCTYVASSGSVSVSMSEMASDATKTVVIYGGTLSALFNDTGIGALGVEVGVGSGSSVARTDYKLGTVLGSFASANTTPSYSTSTYQILVSGTITLASGGTVAEAGVALIFNVGGSLFTFLIAHDAVSPTVTVPAGGTVAVNWTLQI